MHAIGGVRRSTFAPRTPKFAVVPPLNLSCGGGDYGVVLPTHPTISFAAVAKSLGTEHQAGKRDNRWFGGREELIGA